MNNKFIVYMANIQPRIDKIKAESVRLSLEWQDSPETGVLGKALLKLIQEKITLLNIYLGPEQITPVRQEVIEFHLKEAEVMLCMDLD